MAETAASSGPVSFLLLSGGVGQRAQHNEPKQFYELGGHPVIAYSVIAAIQVPEIAEIVVNAPVGYEERTEQIMHSYSGGRPYRIVPSGETRQESCRILTSSASHDRVILHESARPFVDKSMLQELLACSEANASYFLEIPFSMGQVDPVEQTLVRNVPRDLVFNIQLPQIFDRQTLKDAHEAAFRAGRKFTEDSVMCLEMQGARVKALPGRSKNLKITTWEDFAIAEQIMRQVEK